MKIVFAHVDDGSSEMMMIQLQIKIFSLLMMIAITLHHYPARALRALGLLLADGAPTVGGGKTF